MTMTAAWPYIDLKALRMALSNAGIAAPESDEMLAAKLSENLTDLFSVINSRPNGKLKLNAAPVAPAEPDWQKPEQPPEVKLGDAKACWVAVKSTHTGKIHVYVSFYLNMPYDDTREDPDDWTLTTPDGEYIGAEGWCQQKDHEDFAVFYVPEQFTPGERELLAWAPYFAPKYPPENLMADAPQPVGTEPALLSIGELWRRIEEQTGEKWVSCSDTMPGIETAARYVDQLREEYDREHGMVDSETGFMEFGNTSAEEYSNTLCEIADGIRALKTGQAVNHG